MRSYPEHEKLHKVKNESQAIGTFLDTCGYQLGEWRSWGNPPYNQDEFVPVNKPTSSILAAYFGIDEAALEREKDEMLDDFLSAPTIPTTDK